MNLTSQVMTREMEENESMKKKWIDPSVYFLVDGGGEGSEEGEGSGQSSPDIIPYPFEMWLVVFEDWPSILDADGNGTSGEWSDYVKWMTDNGFDSFIDPDEEPLP